MEHIFDAKLGAQNRSGREC